MSFIAWAAVLGAVLLTLALTSSYLRWMPVTTSAVCLLLGMAIGPAGIGWLRLDIKEAASWMEHLTEVAVLFSLFVCGLKLRLPLKDRKWYVAYGLAGPVMLLTISGVCLLLHFCFELAWGPSLLIGAILAPTDPVLASLVQVNDSKDDDPVRFGLSGEAGLNDGMAFAFVILGMLFLQQGNATSAAWLDDWALKRLLWAVPAGLLIGYCMGRGIGRLTLSMRIRNADSTLPQRLPDLRPDCTGLCRGRVGSRLWLSVGVRGGPGLAPCRGQIHGARQPPAEHLVQPVVGHQNVEPDAAVHGDVENLEDTQVAAGIMMSDMLSFGSLVERAMEVFLVTLAGGRADRHIGTGAR
jgi:hypothetical protein